MGVGLGNSMGPAYHKGVPCPWGSLKIPCAPEVNWQVEKVDVTSWPGNRAQPETQSHGAYHPIQRGNPLKKRLYINKHIYIYRYRY